MRSRFARPKLPVLQTLLLEAWIRLQGHKYNNFQHTCLKDWQAAYRVTHLSLARSLPQNGSSRQVAAEPYLLKHPRAVKLFNALPFAGQ